MAEDDHWAVQLPCVVFIITLESLRPDLILHF